MRGKSFLVISLFLAIVNVSIAQEEEFVGQTILKEYLPPTPTAASLGKYVDVPVNLAVGTPNISIPIYNIETGKMNLPITLSYNAGGFRVNEGASWVGLGWSVMAGGVITKSIRHMQDNGTYFTKIGSRNTEFLDPSKKDEYKLLNQLVDGNSVDGFPDLYNYNFGSYSGKFVWNTGEQNLMPANPLKVISVDDNGIIIKGFDGTTYMFSETETIKTRSHSSATLATTSFFISKIISPLGEEINFYYKPTEFFQTVELSESHKYRFTTSQWYNRVAEFTDAFLTTAYGRALTRITFSEGEIVFNSTNDRLDVDKAPNPVIGDYKLNDIEIKDLTGRTIKKVVFSYGYFNENSTDVRARRLKLESIKETPGDDSEFEAEEKEYKFEYETGINLPSRLSKSQDHWGYYNGKINQTLVPNVDRETGEVDLDRRSPDSNFCKANILTKIIYPTGGYSQFSFEGHKYGTDKPETKEISNSITAPLENPPPPVPGDPPIDPNQTSTYFDIKVDKTKVFITSNIFLPDDAEPRGTTAVMLYKAEEESPFKIYGSQENGIHTITLDKGLYKLVVIASVRDSWTRGDYSFSEPIPNSFKNENAGGLRISKILQYDGIDHSKDIIKKYIYTLPDNPSKSSGVLLSFPKYTEDATTFWGGRELSDVLAFSQSVIPLGTGNHITYSSVTVLSGENGEGGKSISYFTTEGNPRTENSDVSWRRGLLREQLVLDVNGKKIKQIINEYDTHEASYRVLYGLTVKNLGRHPQSKEDLCEIECCQLPGESNTCGENNCCNFPRYFGQHPGVMVFEWRYLKKTSELTFSLIDQTKFLEKTTEYKYENAFHQQNTKLIVNSSDGKKYVTQIIYPADYEPGTSFIDEMVANYVHSSPVETIVYQVDGDDNIKIVKGEINEYYNGGKGLLSTNWKLENSKLIDLSNFKFSNQVINGKIPDGTTKGAYTRSADYKLQLSIDNYILNRPVQITKKSNFSVSLIWDNSGNLVIASAVNARLNQIFYNSFETNGNSDLSKTGQKSFEGDYTFTPPENFSADPNSVISYWWFDGTVWNLELKNYSGGAVIMDKGSHIDEVRVYPKGAQMRSYTHSPLKGISSVINENNISTYYKYDGLGNLKEILDYDRNILKHFDYNFVELN